MFTNIRLFYSSGTASHLWPILRRHSEKHLHVAALDAPQNVFNILILNDLTHHLLLEIGHVLVSVVG